MRSIKYLLVVASLCVSPLSLAWNEFGHMLIAELALQKLDPALQRKLDQQAFSLVKQQSSEKRLFLMRAYPDTSAFAHLSVFADDHRNMEIADLYSEFANSLPARFEPMANQNTSTWHYKNQPFYSLSGLRPGQEAPQCDLSQTTDVVWAIENLELAFEEAESPEDQTLALAMLIHFIGDAHQPLHGISRVDADCDSDRGGNGFCVSYRENSYSCETNLHAFWDSSLGFFEAYSVSEAVEFVARVELDEVARKNLDPDEWLAEDFRLARFVYSIKDGSGGDQFYIQDGQVIAYERIALAADRLAQILNELY